MVFDSNGNAVNGSKPDGWNPTTPEGVSATTVTCPNCGVIAFIHLDVESHAPKTRLCPKCHTVLGEW